MTRFRTAILVALLLLTGTTLAQVVIFTETWTCANSDSLDCDTNWTEQNGDTDILSNAAVNQSSGLGKDMFTADTSMGSVNQYLYAQWSRDAVATYAGFMFRFTDSSSPHYEVLFMENEQQVMWRAYANVAGGPTTVGAATALANTDGDVFGVTITGTGTSTVVRVWRNPTGTPTSASDWNGDSTPDVSFTDDPASAVNTGNYAGFTLYGQVADDSRLLSSGGGSTDGGGAPATPCTLMLLGVGKCDLAEWILH